MKWKVYLFVFFHYCNTVVVARLLHNTRFFYLLSSVINLHSDMKLRSCFHHRMFRCSSKPGQCTPQRLMNPLCRGGRHCWGRGYHTGGLSMHVRSRKWRCMPTVPTTLPSSHQQPLRKKMSYIYMCAALSCADHVLECCH